MANVRHVAALALVGWYLMVPHRPGDPSEPIWQWYQANSFDTAEKCNQILAWEMTDDYTNYEKQEGQNMEHVKGYQRALQDAKCISTDDPRLKEK